MSMKILQIKHQEEATLLFLFGKFKRNISCHHNNRYYHCSQGKPVKQHRICIYSIHIQKLGSQWIRSIADSRYYTA